MRHLKTAVLCLVLAAVAIVSGSFLGGTYSRWKLDAEAAAQNAELQSFLEKNVKGIAVNEPFPDVPFWSSDGSESYYIADLLPRGGVAIYIVADCGACVKALDNLAVAHTLLDGKMVPAVVLVGGEASKAAAELAARGVQIPAYGDSQQSLTNEHGVVAFPAFFHLNDAHEVTSFGALREGSGYLVDILRP